MYPFKTVTISAIALMALVQFSPAPFLAIPEAVAAGIGTVSGVVGAAGATAGAVEGGIAASHSHRKRVRAGRFPVGIKRQAPDANQQAWNDCHTQLGSASVTFSAPSTSNILVEGMPPACMTLSTVITGQFDAGNPVPQGSDSVLFQNLADSDIAAIQDALNAHLSSQK